MVKSKRFKWNTPMKICSSFFDDWSDWVEKWENEKYIVWLGISFESWGVEKVNWMLLESLIDEVEVEVDGKKLCILWPLTYEKK